MRLLPKSFVVHRWVVEANKLKLSPIAVSADGMQMHLAHADTVQAYNRMAADAAKDNVRLRIIWAFRSSSLQQKHYEDAQRQHGKRGAIRWVAPPGYSEHHTGWAIDIGDEMDPKADDNPLFERTAAFRWLMQNARRYHFEMSFPKGNWQGVGYEPWHWRFIGTPEAQKVFHPVSVNKFAIWGISWGKAIQSWITVG